MANVIQIKRASAFGTPEDPGTQTLAEGELAWNNAGEILWMGKRIATTGTQFNLKRINPIIAGTGNQITVTPSAAANNVAAGETITLSLPSQVNLTDLTLSGNLTVSGTTTTVNSTVITVDDPIFTLGGDGDGLDDDKDRGIEFKWNNGSAAKVGFFGRNDNTGRFAYIADATNSSEVFSGSLGDAEFNNIYPSGTVDGRDLAADGTKLDGIATGAQVGTVTSVGVSTGLTVSSATTTPSLTLVLSALPNVTADVVGGSDHLIFLDNGSQSKKLINSIKLGQFSNDQGWTSNAGTVTEVSVSDGLDVTSGTTVPDLSLDLEELSDAGTLVGTDKIVCVDGTASRKKAINAIPLSLFDNTATGFTSNAGDITSVGAGLGLGGGGTSGSTTLYLDFTELEESNQPVATDHLVFNDVGTGPAMFEIGDLNLSLFENDLAIDGGTY